MDGSYVKTDSFLDRADLAVRGLAVFSAWCGGVALFVVIGATCLSIAGRTLLSLGFGPIRGDFEIVEIGAGFAVFAFLPLCHLNRGHASVDLLQGLFGDKLNRGLDLIIDLLVLVFAMLLTWRIWLGMLDKRMFGESTILLQFPVWLNYAFGAFGAAVLALAALYTLLRNLLRRPEQPV